MSKKVFRISVEASYDLSVDEIWPDGDAPDDPTVDDVRVEIQKVGEDYLISEWNLTPDVWVNEVKKRT